MNNELGKPLHKELDVETFGNIRSYFIDDARSICVMELNIGWSGEDFLKFNEYLKRICQDSPVWVYSITDTIPLKNATMFPNNFTGMFTRNVTALVNPKSAITIVVGTSFFIQQMGNMAARMARATDKVVFVETMEEAIAIIEKDKQTRPLFKKTES
jgi:hypothetical protein